MGFGIPWRGRCFGVLVLYVLCCELLNREEGKKGCWVGAFGVYIMFVM